MRSACVLCCEPDSGGTLMGSFTSGGTAAERPQRRIFASWRVYDIIRHTGTDGIREHRRQHSLLESQRRYVPNLKFKSVGTTRELFMNTSVVGSSIFKTVGAIVFVTMAISRVVHWL